MLPLRSDRARADREPGNSPQRDIVGQRPGKHRCFWKRYSAQNSSSTHDFLHIPATGGSARAKRERRNSLDNLFDIKKFRLDHVVGGLVRCLASVQQ